MPQILAVVLNYRTTDLTLACLDTLQPELVQAGARVLVVDNGSGDGELEAALRRRGHANEIFVGLPANHGFAGGINRALAREKPTWDYLWLLNSDTRVKPGALAALVDALERDPRAAIAGSRLDRRAGDEAWQGAFAFPSFVSEWELGAHTQLVSRCLGRPTAADSSRWSRPTPVDWVPGASALVRRKAWDRVGPLDEKYFLYFEDVDWCFRAARRGWLSLYVPASRVEHLCGGSRADKKLPPSWFESRRRFWRKRRGQAYSLAADWAFFFGWGVSWLRPRTRRALSEDPPDLLRSHFADHVKAWGGGTMVSEADRKDSK